MRLAATLLERHAAEIEALKHDVARAIATSGELATDNARQASLLADAREALRQIDNYHANFDGDDYCGSAQYYHHIARSVLKSLEAEGE